MNANSPRWGLPRQAPPENPRWCKRSPARKRLPPPTKKNAPQHRVLSDQLCGATLLVDATPTDEVSWGWGGDHAANRTVITTIRTVATTDTSVWRLMLCMGSPSQFLRWNETLW